MEASGVRSSQMLTSQVVNVDEKREFETVEMASNMFTSFNDCV